MNTNDVYIPSDLRNLIQHHGVMGMKWGKKKTSQIAGAIHNKVAEKKANKAYAKDWQKSYTNRRKLSDSELRDKVNRLQLETNYGKLVAQTRISDRKKAKKYMSEFKSGKTFSSNLDNVSKTLSTAQKLKKQVGSAAISAAISAAVTSAVL